MEMLNWKYENNKYWLELPQGKAIVTEFIGDSGRLYKPRIEDQSGNLIAEFLPGLDDFDTANTYVRVNLILLDKLDTDENEFTQKLISTLDYCIDLLDTPNRVFHRQRVIEIKNWFLHQKSVNAKPPQHDWNDFTFNWKSQGNEYTCDVPPHGKIIITETSTKDRFSFGSVDEYDIKLQDSSGVMLKSFYVPTVGFLEAEDRVRTMLIDLETSFIDKVYIMLIDFTLEICGRLLPVDADLMHTIRLEYMVMYLGEVLP